MPTLVTGVVRDHRGKPVQGARVAVVSAPTDMPDIAALTGRDGRFTFAVPQPGSYTIACFADGYARADVSIRVSSSSPPAELDVRLRREGGVRS
jgi:hypothetical protein